MKRRWKIAAYAFLLFGVILLASVTIFLFYPDTFINTFLKGRITAAFREAYPEYSIRIGAMHYSIQENRVGFDSVSLTSKDSTISGTISSYSLSGIGWWELLLAGGLVPRGFAGTVLEARGIVVNFPQEQYELRCELLYVSVPDSEIVVEALGIHPSGDDKQFFAADKFRRTRFNVAVPHTRVTGLACLEMLQGKSYRTRSVHVNDLFIDVLINKEKPSARDTARPPMPNEILTSIEEVIDVDSVHIWNGGLRYGERFAALSGPAVITLDSMQVSVLGIVNHKAGDDTTVIRARGRFMKSAPMTILMSIPISSPTFSFQYSGSVGRMDVRALNSFLETAEQMRIKSGVLQAATFDIKVVSGEARGNVRAVYRDLSLAAINKQTGSDGGLFDGIASFIANTFVIRGSNLPDGSGSVEIGTVKYARQWDDPFFRFVWFSLRSGLGDLVGF